MSSDIVNSIRRTCRIYSACRCRRAIPAGPCSLSISFFERINPFFSILDPELHTPGNLIWSCPVSPYARNYFDRSLIIVIEVSFHCW